MVVPAATPGATPGAADLRATDTGDAGDERSTESTADRPTASDGPTDPVTATNSTANHT